jgi:hypothetical protein
MISSTSVAGTGKPMRQRVLFYVLAVALCVLVIYGAIVSH